MRAVAESDRVTYAVTVDARLDAARRYDADEVVDLLHAHSGAIAGDREGVSATFDVVASSPAAAAERGQRILRRAMESAGAHVVAFSSVSVLTAAEQERALATPVLPALLGLAEVAEELRVTKQRVAQLRGRPDFPDPVAELAAGPVWTETSLARFIESWDRRPGRPRTISGDDLTVAL